MKTFRTIIAFFQAILPFLGFCIIGAVIYSQAKYPFNVIGAIVLISLGFFLSRIVFNLMRKRGVIEILTANHASPDLDVLEPTLGDGVVKLTSVELETYFSAKKLEFKEGTVSIWGDWEGRQLNARHRLQSINFNPTKSILTLAFTDNCLLKIRGPKLILCSRDYLKIVMAKEVLWQTPNRTKTNDQYSYLNTGETIKTKSNTNWKPHAYDTGIGLNAIYLQG